MGEAESKKQHGGLENPHILFREIDAIGQLSLGDAPISSEHIKPTE